MYSIYVSGTQIIHIYTCFICIFRVSWTHIYYTYTSYMCPGGHICCIYMCPGYAHYIYMLYVSRRVAAGKSPGSGARKNRQILVYRSVRLFLFVCFAPSGAPQKPGVVAAAPASKTARRPARRPVAIYHYLCRSQCYR